MKNYYVVLGVGREASQRRIKQAFREMAKRSHPDRGGEEKAFQDVREAYHVLGDPTRREDYNAALRRTESGRLVAVRRPGESEPGPGIRERVVAAPEPLLQRRRRPPSGRLREPISVLRDFETHRPSLEGVKDLFRGALPRSHSKSASPQRLGVEIVLTPAEAARGGTVRFLVPTFPACPACLGAGRAAGYPCLECEGTGRIEREMPVAVRIPPFVSEGTLIPVPLARHGGPDAHLMVCIRLG